ncbi:MAG: hypothetical protein N3E36_02205 [Sulfolobales archaeon]|nr:hypothetical protein [Sulfolobales archaeon]MCX8198826.1 hypothetical protein [Sulfolobales archaeon]MDW8170776.1 hypothetical protein [Desulfurococcaceae archaeon]
MTEEEVEETEAAEESSARTFSIATFSTFLDRTEKWIKYVEGNIRLEELIDFLRGTTKTRKAGKKPAKKKK